MFVTYFDFFDLSITTSTVHNESLKILKFIIIMNSCSTKKNSSTVHSISSHIALYVIYPLIVLDFGIIFMKRSVGTQAIQNLSDSIMTPYTTTFPSK